jgi:hypothetical protein
LEEDVLDELLFRQNSILRRYFFWRKYFSLNFLLPSNNF